VTSRSHKHYYIKFISYVMEVLHVSAFMVAIIRLYVVE